MKVEIKSMNSIQTHVGQSCMKCILRRSVSSMASSLLAAVLLDAGTTVVVSDRWGLQQVKDTEKHKTSVCSLSGPTALVFPGGKC